MGKHNFIQCSLVIFTPLTQVFKDLAPCPLPAQALSCFSVNKHQNPICAGDKSYEHIHVNSQMTCAYIMTILTTVTFPTCNVLLT